MYNPNKPYNPFEYLNVQNQFPGLQYYGGLLGATMPQQMAPQNQMPIQAPRMMTPQNIQMDNSFGDMGKAMGEALAKGKSNGETPSDSTSNQPGLDKSNIDFGPNIGAPDQQDDNQVMSWLFRTSNMNRYG